MRRKAAAGIDIQVLGLAIWVGWVLLIGGYEYCSPE